MLEEKGRFKRKAAAVITQLGAFSLQFRSRSGCVFVARWRSGLTIGVARAALSLARAPPRCSVLRRVKQKKRNNFIWQRRREAFVRFLCLWLYENTYKGLFERFASYIILRQFCFCFSILLKTERFACYACDMISLSSGCGAFATEAVNILLSVVLNNKIFLLCTSFFHLAFE